MIEIEGLTKTYKERTVLDIDALSIKPGESVAVIGPNGSGKSTLLKIIAGIVKQSSGDCKTPGDILYLPQNSTGFSMSVEKNILYGAKNKENAKQDASYLMSLMKIGHLKDKKANSLSGGELQKTALCRLLINDCNILLLDEPTASTDIESAEIIRKAIAGYKEKNGCTLIVSTHSPLEAKELAGRIIMLNDGRIAEDASPDELLENPSTEWGKKFLSQWKF